MKMKKGILLSLNLMISFFLLGQTQKSLIVKFRPGVTPDGLLAETHYDFNIKKVDILNKNNGLQSIKMTGDKSKGDTYVINLMSNQEIQKLIALYEETKMFEFVESNFLGNGHGHAFQSIPNDTFFNRQWSHFNDGTFSLSNATVDSDIDSDLAWDLTKGDSNLIVAILDSGLKLDHPEFTGRIWINPNETQDGIDNDHNHYIDDYYGGWDFVNNDNDPTDDHGHGTNVTGIALASGNNNNGYAGMNWNSKIMICKILDDNNSGFYSWWADAIYYAVDNGASVINLSAGGNSSSFLLEEAINYAYDNNVPIVVSTGNQNSMIQYPAKYLNTLAIGSTNSDDTRSLPFFWSNTSGSNYGLELDFVAPGNYIYGLSHISNTDFNRYWGGTSQAAPHVTGVVSLLLSLDPDLTVSEIKTILKESSEDQIGDLDDTVGWDQYYGYGRVNAYNALVSRVLSSCFCCGLENDIVLYPNPISKNDTIKISNVHKGTYDIEIYNFSGQLFKKTEIEIKDFETIISIPHLNSGMYFFNIKNQLNFTSISKKIIVK